MKPTLLLIVLLLTAVAFGQDKHRRIGEIDFYGYGGLDLNKIRAALPFREGAELSDSDDAVMAAIGDIRAAVTRTVGKAPTDVAAVCCDAQGNAMFYIGLPGSSMRIVRYNLPQEVRCTFPQESCLEGLPV